MGREGIHIPQKWPFLAPMWHNFRRRFSSFSVLKALAKLGCPDQAPISKLPRFLEVFWPLPLLLNRQGRLMIADDVAAFGVACEPAEHLEAVTTSYPAHQVATPITSAKQDAPLPSLDERRILFLVLFARCEQTPSASAIYPLKRRYTTSITKK
jgi:hypothetical protein